MSKKDDEHRKREKAMEKRLFGKQRPSREEGTRCPDCGGFYQPGGRCDGCRP